jgi:hypothetical protein
MTKPSAREIQDALRAHLRALGSKGGKRGGPARMSNLTAEQRSALGKKAAAARWKKKRTAR